MISSDSQIFEGKKKKMAAQIWTEWENIGPKTRFFAIFLSVVH